MSGNARASVGTSRACEALRDHLLRNGPATAQDLLGILALSRSGTYQVIRTAARRGLIRAVAHVHSDDNHDPQAWDIDSPDGELLWRREGRLRGRFCTCRSKRDTPRRAMA